MLHPRCRTGGTAASTETMQVVVGRVFAPLPGHYRLRASNPATRTVVVRARRKEMVLSELPAACADERSAAPPIRDLHRPTQQAGVAQPLARARGQRFGDLDPAMIRRELTSAEAELGLVACIDGVLMPAVRRLRLLAAADDIDGAQLLMATEAMHGWINLRQASAPPPGDGDPIVLSCGPRDSETVGLEALGLLLRMRRQPCWVLGARTPLGTLVIAARASQAAAVVLLSEVIRVRMYTVAAGHAVHRVGIPVFFTGSAFAEAPGPPPGCYLGAVLGPACAAILADPSVGATSVR